MKANKTMKEQVVPNHTKPQLQKILQGILHTENESKQNHERISSAKPQEKKRPGIRQKP
jgi:hypothetical protein